MKCFLIRNSEFALPNDFFVRVGATNGDALYYQHVYCSRKTFKKIEKRIEAFCKTNYADKAQARKQFLSLLFERAPKICDGLKQDYVLVDTKAITREILDEEFVNDLAASNKGA